MIRRLPLLAWIVIACAAARGQGMYEDRAEVSAYGGAAFGTLGTHGWVGASSGTQFFRYASAHIDCSFLPLGDTSLTNNPSIVAHSRLYNFNFAFHIDVPVKKRWAPYALVGEGLLYNTYEVPSIAPNGATYYRSEQTARFGFETGGGVSYYIRGNWGVRSEYRYTFAARNFSRLLGGFFYEFEGDWPFLPHKSKRRGRGVAY